uniref:RNA-dependent RNA polymerase n=1 Tax=Picullus virus TaxID=2800938 RepID=A0A894KPA7_9VIRU|nr:MAG: RNA-dependent RNA polymerase [Picullus virus]
MHVNRKLNNSCVKRGAPEVLGPRSAHELQELSRTLGRIFSVRLDCASLDAQTNLKNGKEFCVGLLENRGNHAWGSEVSKLHPRKGLSIAGSLFLARKVLPCPPDPLLEKKHAALLSSPAPAPPPEFISFIERSICDMFPIGWDRGYKRAVFSYTPNSSSCLEFSRSEGGVQRFLSSMGPNWFQDQCLGAGCGSIPYPVKFSTVKTSGKERGVTVAGGIASLLGPLHKTIYAHISDMPWLMRGEARGRKFHSFHRVKGEVFVSGDYESATDNLRLETAELILRTILGRCRNVPAGIAEFAMSSLRAEIRYSDGSSIEQKRGQLMGNLLSFPLLCLQNYLAFKFLVPKPVPVKINGDDIVFRASRSDFDVWSEGVGALGLTLSRGKTLVDPKCFSLNSAFFYADRNRVREVPVIRLKESDGSVPSGGDFSRFCRNWRGMARTLVGALWLRRKSGAIKACGRSVVGLGIPADNSQVHWSGLGRREAWFRAEHAHLAAPEAPVPILNRKVSPNVTKEWTKLPNSSQHPGRKRKEWHQAFIEACFNHAWSDQGGCRESAEDLWWEEVKSSGMETAWRNYKAALRKRPHLYRGWVRFDLRLRSVPLPERVPSFWCPKDQVDLPRAPGHVLFVDGLS